jgi:CTP:molybdopterin cytidylyltransferase MocA
VRFGAVIAAAGLAKRMGAFKPLLPLGNSTFIERIINSLREGGVKDITVVTGRDAALIKKALAAYQVTFIHNADYPVTDMMFSASLGLAFMADQVDAVFFTPADIPLFTARTVRLLAGTLRRGGDIVIPAYQGKMGHPVIIRSTAVPELTTCGKPGGLRAAVDAYGGPKSILETADPGILYDADTPEAYKFVAARFPSNTLTEKIFRGAEGEARKRVPQSRSRAEAGRRG